MPSPAPRGVRRGGEGDVERFPKTLKERRGDLVPYSYPQLEKGVTLSGGGKGDLALVPQEENLSKKGEFR